MFSERLNKILTLLDVTSGGFARFAGCDKSYISRMTSGARVPKKGGASAWRIVDGIYASADEKGKTAGICELISCKDQNSADGIKSQIMAWLYDGETSIGFPQPMQNLAPSFKGLPQYLQ